MAKTLKTHWYSKTIDALQLARMSESTQKSYARAVRMLIEHFEKDPPPDNRRGASVLFPVSPK